MSTETLPFQVLVIPYRKAGSRYEYCAFQRAVEDGIYWQWIAGDGEGPETPLGSAKRESLAVAGIPQNKEYLELPENAFAVNVGRLELGLSDAYLACQWLPYDRVRDLLKWDRHKNALGELDQRLRQPVP